MRFVERNLVPKPKFLDSSEFNEMRSTLAKIHDTAGGGKRSKQRVFSFDELFSQFRSEAIQALRKVFHDKCAYTESPSLPEIPLKFHLHRPGGDAMGFGDSIDPEHYWWLQTEWHNWMLVSPQLDSIKGTNFPVAGPRMALDARTSTDLGVLINPCEEEPAWWLEFNERGETLARHIESEAFNKPFADLNRGEINIRQLDLNNEQLMAERRYAIKDARLNKLFQISDNAPEGMLDRALDPSIPYMGALRQQMAKIFCNRLERLRLGTDSDTMFVEAVTQRLAPEIAAYLCSNPKHTRQLREHLGQKLFKPLMRPVIELALEKCPDLKDLFVMSSKTATVLDVDDVQMEVKATGPLRVEPHTKMAATQANTIGRSALLQRIRIRNFKAIEDLTIEIPIGVKEISTGPLYDRKLRTRAVNWKMLLGENASGKSSILQAIALALFGPDIEKDPPVKVDEVRRRGIGNKTSFIQLFFRGFDRPVKLKLNKSGFKYEWAPDYHTFVRAYGATRLFRSDRELWDENQPLARCRVGNLFDPMFPVVDVDTWLIKLNKGDFNVAARAIRELIAGVGDSPTGTNNEVELHRDIENNRVMLGEDTLKELSDGYRALLAMICDIMAGLGAGLSDMENAVGIVLLDEIGAHLHPRLRMQVVSRMRYIFPRIQFIASTHEPLCLRGLFEEEVDRIRRSNGTVSQETIARSPSSYRVDQLLTSEFFGLETTIDPEIDDQFQHYYHLLSKSNLDDKEIRKRDQLRTRLITEGVLGYTRRDQLVYEAIDSYLADKRMKSADPSSSTALQLKKDTIYRIKRYWGMAELKHMGQGVKDDQS